MLRYHTIYMMTTPQHLSQTNQRVSEVQARIDAIEGHGREVEKSPLRLASSLCIVFYSTSLLSIQKNEGLTWR